MQVIGRGIERYRRWMTDEMSLIKEISFSFRTGMHESGNQDAKGDRVRCIQIMEILKSPKSRFRQRVGMYARRNQDAKEDRVRCIQIMEILKSPKSRFRPREGCTQEEIKVRKGDRVRLICWQVQRPFTPPWPPPRGGMSALGMLSCNFQGHDQLYGLSTIDYGLFKMTGMRALCMLKCNFQDLPLYYFWLSTIDFLFSALLTSISHLPSDLIEEGIKWAW